MKKENTSETKKNNNFPAATISLMLAVVLLAVDLSLLINQPTNILGLAGTTCLMLVWVFFFVRALFQEMERSRSETTSYLEAILKSEKAFFLMQRKLENEMHQFGEYVKLPSEQVIKAQKAIAKVTINRSRENTDALMESNSQLLEKLTGFEEILSDISTEISAKDIPAEEKQPADAAIEDTLRAILMEQKEVTANIRDMQFSLKEEVTKAVDGINDMQAMKDEMAKAIDSINDMQKIRDEMAKAIENINDMQEKMPVYVQQPIIQEQDQDLNDNITEFMTKETDSMQNHMESIQKSVTDEVKEETPISETAAKLEEVLTNETIGISETETLSETETKPQELQTAETTETLEIVESPETITAPEELQSAETTGTVEIVESPETITAPEELRSAETTGTSEMFPVSETAETTEELPITETVPAPEELQSAETTGTVEIVESPETVTAPEELQSAGTPGTSEEVFVNETITAPEELQSAETTGTVEIVESPETVTAPEELQSAGTPGTSEEVFVNETITKPEELQSAGTPGTSEIVEPNETTDISESILLSQPEPVREQDTADSETEVMEADSSDIGENENLTMKEILASEATDMSSIGEEIKTMEEFTKESMVDEAPENTDSSSEELTDIDSILESIQDLGISMDEAPSLEDSIGLSEGLNLPEEPVSEPDIDPIEEKPIMPDLSNPNKMMTPDEIAALLANM